MTALLARITVLAAAACLAACGCASRSGPADLPRFNAIPPRPVPPAAVIPAAHQEPAPAPRLRDATAALTPDEAVRLVLERNPTLDQMRASAAAAAARYPQVTSLDDPNFAFATAPGSIGSPNANYAARVEVSQKFLYPGKRALKGESARAGVAAALEDVEDARLQLTEAARSALADYYLAVKGTTVAEENLKLLREFRQNAETRYKTGQGQQQDMLQADVEIGRQEERLVSLRRARQVAVARLNTLMHLPPDGTLPPPADVAAGSPLADAAGLRAAAAGRPDVRAAAARVVADEAALALALKEYNPDFEVMAAYDGFWQGASGRPLQWQLGARVNLPVRQARRGGAVDEARANVARRRAELARLTDQVNFEVQQAFEQVREADDVVRLYDAKLLPAAEANVKEARAGYAAGKVPFLNLVEAQRNRAALAERYFEAVAESARRRAALDRATGGPVAPAER
jgi:cobalt-zinc-cadmium efflux system outer membrane protein